MELRYLSNWDTCHIYGTEIPVKQIFVNLRYLSTWYIYGTEISVELRYLSSWDIYGTEIHVKQIFVNLRYLSTWYIYGTNRSVKQRFFWTRNICTDISIKHVFFWIVGPVFQFIDSLKCPLLSYISNWCITLCVFFILI